MAPAGNVYQAGTLSGNPLAMIAGYTLLKTLKDNPGIYTDLEEKTAYLGEGLHRVLSASGWPFVINRFGSMISVHFSDKPVIDLASASLCNLDLFKRFFHAMLDRGVYLPPSAFESWFLNNALTTADLDKTIEAAAQSLAAVV